MVIKLIVMVILQLRDNSNWSFHFWRFPVGPFAQIAREDAKHPGKVGERNNPQETEDRHEQRHEGNVKRGTHEDERANPDTEREPVYKQVDRDYRAHEQLNGALLDVQPECRQTSCNL